MALAEAMDSEDYDEDLRDMREEQNRSRRTNTNDVWSNRVRENRPDSALVVRAFSVWPWCQTSDAARDSADAR